MADIAGKVVDLKTGEILRERRPMDDVWDACVEVLGYSPLTETERRLWGKFVHSLTNAGADKEKIHAVADWYRRHWPGIDLTITSIEKWYSHFLQMHEKKNRTRSSVCPDCEMGGGRHAADCSAVSSSS